MLQCDFSVAQKSNEKVPFLTKSLSKDLIKEVQVQTTAGSISVEGITSGEQRVEVYVVTNNNKKNFTREEIQEQVNEQYDLNITVSSNSVIATAKVKQKIKDWKDALSFSFKVFVPVEVSANLTTSGGSISLNNLSGNLSFTTSGGSLNVDHVSGIVKGRTSGGSINVSESKNDINLTTSGGSITAKNCDGNLQLSTSGGSLKLQDLKGDIKATTSGGSIDGDNIAGELLTQTSGGNIHLSNLRCSLETSTSGGNIDVAVATLGKYIRISNSAGNVELKIPGDQGVDLDLSAHKINTESFQNFSGKMDDKEVVGKLNGGGVAVRVNAGSGKIYMRLK